MYSELHYLRIFNECDHLYRGADKFLVRTGWKQATATEDFDVHMSYLLSQLEEY